MHIYMPLMKSLAPTIQKGATYTYFTEKIWLSQSKYSHMPQNSKLHLILHMLLQNMCQKQI